MVVRIVKRVLCSFMLLNYLMLVSMNGRELTTCFKACFGSYCVPRVAIVSQTLIEIFEIKIKTQTIKMTEEEKILISS